MSAPDRLMATVSKNSHEEFQVHLRTRNDRRGVDLRVFKVHGGRGLGPTPKGVSIKPEALGAVIRGLQSAEAALIAEGVIEEVEASAPSTASSHLLSPNTRTSA